MDDSRMSCAVTTAVAPVSWATNSANAAPMARATSSSHSSGTTPRTSYALMIDDRSAHAASSLTAGATRPSGLERERDASGQVGEDAQVAAARAAAVVGRVARPARGGPPRGRRRPGRAGRRRWGRSPRGRSRGGRPPSRAAPSGAGRGTRRGRSCAVPRRSPTGRQRPSTPRTRTSRSPLPVARSRCASSDVTASPPVPHDRHSNPAQGSLAAGAPEKWAPGPGAPSCTMTPWAPTGVSGAVLFARHDPPTPQTPALAP